MPPPYVMYLITVSVLLSTVFAMSMQAGAQATLTRSKPGTAYSIENVEKAGPPQQKTPVEVGFKFPGRSYPSKDGSAVGETINANAGKFYSGSVRSSSNQVIYPAGTPRLMFGDGGFGMKALFESALLSVSECETFNTWCCGQVTNLKATCGNAAECAVSLQSISQFNYAPQNGQFTDMSGRYWLVPVTICNVGQAGVVFVTAF